MKDTCIPLFIAALFTISRRWKQPRCPLTNERIKKLWYIYTMKYYSAIKRNTFESVLMRCVNLEPNIQSEVSQRKINVVFLSIYMEFRKMVLKNLFTGQQWRNRQRIDLRTWGEERVRCMERVTWKFTLPYVKYIANGNLLYGSGGSVST